MPRKRLRRKSKRSIDQFWSLNGDWISMQSIADNMTFVVFAAFLVFATMAYRNYCYKQVYKLDRMGKEIRELKWEYMSTKAEHMYDSKQTQVAKLVSDQEIKQLDVPPIKIVYDKNEY